MMESVLKIPRNNPKVTIKKGYKLITNFINSNTAQSFNTAHIKNIWQQLTLAQLSLSTISIGTTTVLTISEQTFAL